MNKNKGSGGLIVAASVLGVLAIVLVGVILVMILPVSWSS